MMDEHLDGWKHKAEKKAVRPRAEGRYCDVCAVAFTGPEQLAEHLKGQAHADGVRWGGRGKGGKDGKGGKGDGGKGTGKGKDGKGKDGKGKGGKGKGGKGKDWKWKAGKGGKG